MDPRSATAAPSCEVHAAPVAGGDGVLTPEALRFLAELTREFRPELDRLLTARRERRADRAGRARGAGGPRFDFPAETRAIRESAWRVAPPPKDLERRIVEITGPVDAKTVINALNSAADVFMADFEDATAPTFANLVRGQQNLADAVRRTLTFDDAGTGKRYRLGERTAVLVARPRGLHLSELHVTLERLAIPAAFFDAGLFVFHCARALLDRGSGPYLYLPKLESRHEARLWSRLLSFLEDRLALPPASIRVTVLIETLPAAFEMDEILFELKERVTGLNCGRWDYIFSFIKEHADDPRAVLPDRQLVTMEQPFLRAYARLLVKTCHRRGAHAIGGMSASIPNRHDPAVNEAALASVRADKAREVADGFDGAWVAHPGLVSAARSAFTSRMSVPHQLHVTHDDVDVRAGDLLAVPAGDRTVSGLRKNVRVAIRYLEAWLSGTGCVPLYGLMEDVATAEIARTQVWQWMRHGTRLDDGHAVTRERLQQVIAEEMRRVQVEVGLAEFAGGRYRAARELFDQLCSGKEPMEFLTLAAYGSLCAFEN